MRRSARRGRPPSAAIGLVVLIALTSNVLQPLLSRAQKVNGFFYNMQSRKGGTAVLKIEDNDQTGEVMEPGHCYAFKWLKTLPHVSVVNLDSGKYVVVNLEDYRSDNLRHLLYFSADQISATQTRDQLFLCRYNGTESGSACPSEYDFGAYTDCKSFDVVL